MPLAYPPCPCVSLSAFVAFFVPCSAYARQCRPRLRLPTRRRRFAPTGVLAQGPQALHPRAGQQAMAQAVAQAIDDAATLVVEAGTGVGKTFAYLVPALLSGRESGGLHRHQSLARPVVRARSAQVAAAAGPAVAGSPAQGGAAVICACTA